MAPNACRQEWMVPDDVLLDETLMLEGPECIGELVLAVDIVDLRSRQVLLDATPEPLVDTMPRERKAIWVLPELHYCRDDERMPPQDVGWRIVTEWYRKRERFLIVEELLPTGPGPQYLDLTARILSQYSGEVGGCRHEAVQVADFRAEVRGHPRCSTAYGKESHAGAGLVTKTCACRKPRRFHEYIWYDEELVAERSLPTIHRARRTRDIVVPSEEAVDANVIAGLDAAQVPKQSRVQGRLHSGPPGARPRFYLAPVNVQCYRVMRSPTTPGSKRLLYPEDEPLSHVYRTQR